MADPNALLQNEARGMGRECSLVGHETLPGLDTPIEVIVYDVAPPEHDLFNMGVQRRYAIYHNGLADFSGIVGNYPAGDDA